MGQQLSALQAHTAELATVLATREKLRTWLTAQPHDTSYGPDEDFDSPVEAWLDKTYRDFYHFMHVGENDDGIAAVLRFVSSASADDEFSEMGAPAWLAVFEIDRDGLTITAGKALALLNESAERS